jgi:hypothetical protein
MLLYLLRAVRVSLMACEQMRSMIPDGIDHRPFPILFFYFYMIIPQQHYKGMRVEEREKLAH